MLEANNLQSNHLNIYHLNNYSKTSLRKDADKYGYIYDINPPYELIASNDLSKEDIKKIHIVEDNCLITSLNLVKS